jgi:hypothetical protein
MVKENWEAETSVENREAVDPFIITLEDSTEWIGKRGRDSSQNSDRSGIFAHSLHKLFSRI